MKETQDIIFFRIWRNSYIRKMIFSFIGNGFKFGTFKYDQIVSASWMLSNGYFELLKYKVIRQQYLLFNLNDKNDITKGVRDNNVQRVYDNGRKVSLNTYSIYNLNNIQFKGTSSITSEELDEFYYHLFKNYSNYYLHCNIYETEFMSIEYDNEIALNQLSMLSQGNYKFKFKSFFKCVEIGSFKCAWLIYSNLSKKKKNSSNFKKLWNMVLVDRDHSLIIDKWYRIGISGKMKNRAIDFIVNKCNIQYLPSSSLTGTHLKGIFDYHIYNETLSTIIQSIKTILLLKDNFKYFIDQINKKKLKIKLSGKEQHKKEQLCEINKIANNLNINIMEFEKEFNSMVFTQQQLNMVIKEFGTSSTDTDCNVLKCVTFLTPFTRASCHPNFLLDNLLYLELKYGNNDVTKLYEEIKSLFLYGPTRISSWFGYYNFKDMKESSDCVGLFQFCPNQRELQVSFIENLVIDLINLKNQNINHFNTLFLEVFKILVYLNYIDLVSILLSISNSTISQYQEVYKEICSIEMFELLNERIPIGQKDNNYIISLIILNNRNYSYNLLNHLKNNYNQIYRNEIQHVNLSNEKQFMVFKFFYENIDDISQDNYELIRFNLSTELTLEQFKFLVDNTPSDKQYYCNYEIYEDSKYSNDQFNYIFNYYKQDIVSGRCQINNTYFTNIFKYFNGKSSISLISSSIDLSEYEYVISTTVLLKIVSYEVGQYGNTAVLDSLFKNVGINRFTIQSILKIICDYGNLNVFKYLVDKYSLELCKSLELSSTPPGKHSVIQFIKNSQFLVMICENGYLDFSKTILEIDSPITFEKPKAIDGSKLLSHSGDNAPLVNYYKFYSSKYNIIIHK